MVACLRLCLQQPALARVRVVSALLLLDSPAVRASWQDEIGYTRLVQELGVATPNGAGVSVTLVEATLTAAGGEYLPVAEEAPMTGNFSGKVFGFESGASAVSSHAVRTGSFFFGANTDPLAGDASVAPLAGTSPLATVRCYEADGWLWDDFLRLGSLQLPRVETHAVSNHSWIGAVAPEFPAATASEALRRLDWSVAAGDHVAVVGVNNGSATVVPPLLASAFNVLSVGRTDGLHSTGTSSGDVDGPGRVKPELVAPTTATSWSTAVVSSCAALLTQAAAGVSPVARRSEVMRALLLAGSRKDPFPGWANTTTRPLDPHFGAGEVNVWRSHLILAAGSVSDGAASSVGRSGWHFSSSIAPGQVRSYSLAVPDGCVARELSAALVWNRTVTTTPSTLWREPSPELANLDLSLAAVPADAGPAVEITRSESGAAGSTPHPLEYLHLRDTPAGRYTLGVHQSATGSRTTGYGIAWYLSLAPAAPPEVATQWSADGESLTLGFSRLGVGLTYALEKSSDLLSWESVQSVTATTTTTEILVSGFPSRAFYRLMWVP